MANSSDQEYTSVSNLAKIPLLPKFISIMKSAAKAKFDAELFKSKIDLLARQYSQGFDEILRRGANETLDEVICEAATKMNMEVSIYMVKLEDFKAKLKNGSVDQDNDGPLLGNSPIGIQEVRDGVLQLQQQIRNMEDSNSVFQKLFEDATALNEERLLEITALKKELSEALESNCKLTDDMNQIPVPPVVAMADESIQTNVKDFHTMCAPLVELQEDCEKFNKWFEEHRDRLVSVRKEFVEKMRVLNVKRETCEQAYASADLSLGISLGVRIMELANRPHQIQFLARFPSIRASIANGSFI